MTMYPDEYLSRHVTFDRETRAAADVAELGSFPAAWAEKLAILRAYVITCLECSKGTDDVFAAKLGQYRKEFDTALPLARAAQAAASATIAPSMFAVALERA